PHGKVLVEDIARSLGMSERTLARKLSDEGLNFTEILQHLRRDLAVRYLKDRKLHVSKIAWLLGFREVSAVTHAYKRWNGKAPSRTRTASAYGANATAASDETAKCFGQRPVAHAAPGAGGARPSTGCNGRHLPTSLHLEFGGRCCRARFSLRAT